MRDLFAQTKQLLPEVEVKQITIPGGEETSILCRTPGRKEKEKAIRLAAETGATAMA
jgi:hypothetical protein